MAQLTAGFETGVSGNNVLVADAGNATPWDAETISGGAITYDNAHVHGAGSLAGQFAHTASATYLSWTTALGAVTDHYGRVYLYATGNPASATRGPFAFYNSGALTSRWEINTNGTLAARDTVAATNGSVAISLNQWVRIEWHVVHSATVGIVEVKLFNSPESSTASDTITRSSANTGTQANEIQVGQQSGGPTYTYWLDGIVANAGSYPGPIFNGFTNTVVPTVTGALAVGGTLTANPGTWTPTPGSYGYYWHRADDNVGTNLVEIAGATGSTYTLAAGDTSKYIRAGVIPSQ